MTRLTCTAAHAHGRSFQASPGNKHKFKHEATACQVREQLTSRPASLSLRQTSYAFTLPCSLMTIAFKSPLPRTYTNTASAVKLPGVAVSFCSVSRNMCCPTPAFCRKGHAFCRGCRNTANRLNCILQCSWPKSHSSSKQAYTGEQGANHCCASRKTHKH